jgi:Fur family peroxide stress response transcriptional regulator
MDVPYYAPDLGTRRKRIVDPDMSTLGDLSEELAKKTGYQIVTHRLDFHGICPRCQSTS